MPIKGHTKDFINFKLKNTDVLKGIFFRGAPFTIRMYYWALRMESEGEEDSFDCL